VAEKLALVAGVDRDVHRAELVDGEPGGDGVDIVVQDRRHRVAPSDAQIGQPPGDPVRTPIEVTVGVDLTGEVEECPLRVALHGTGQGRGDRAGRIVLRTAHALPPSSS
jgi:hypothetical protein